MASWRHPYVNTWPSASTSFLTIDPQGVQTIRELTKGSIAIFVISESLDQLVEQLNRRNQNTAEQRSQQLINAWRELAHLSEYDYVIVNRHGRVEEAADQLLAIMAAEHSRVQRRCPEL